MLLFQTLPLVPRFLDAAGQTFSAFLNRQGLLGRRRWPQSHDAIGIDAHTLGYSTCTGLEVVRHRSRQIRLRSPARHP